MTWLEEYLVWRRSEECPGCKQRTAPASPAAFTCTRCLVRLEDFAEQLARLRAA